MPLIFFNIFNNKSVNKNIDYYKLFQDAIINTGKTNDLKKISAKITEEIRKITKFDRVLIYRF